MTTISLSKACGTLRPVRRGEALEGLRVQDNGFSIRHTDGAGGAAGITSAPGIDDRVPRDIGISCAGALYPSNKSF
jgi:hypothetical protein